MSSSFATNGGLMGWIWTGTILAHPDRGGKPEDTENYKDTAPNLQWLAQASGAHLYDPVVVLVSEVVRRPGVAAAR